MLFLKEITSYIWTLLIRLIFLSIIYILWNLVMIIYLYLSLILRIWFFFNYLRT